MCICISFFSILWSVWQITACVGGACEDLSSQLLAEYGVAMSPDVLISTMLGGTDTRALQAVAASFAITLVVAILLSIQLWCSIIVGIGTRTPSER